MHIIDIPDLHEIGFEYQEEFFRILSQHKKLSLFSKPVIQYFVDSEWPLARTSMFVIFSLFLIYLGLFVTYSNVLNGQVFENEYLLHAKLIIGYILIGISSFFILTEFIQLIYLRLYYFSSFWNLIDMSVHILVIVVCAYKAKQLKDPEFEIPATVISAHSFASLLMWSKFLYFLKIFKETNYYVRAVS